MSTASTLKVTTPSDREIAMIREFDAPRKLVWAAHTQPELVRRWLTGPPGWEMPECTIDLRVGGKYRYVWQHADGRTMGMGGEYIEVVEPERIVCTEVFDQKWYDGEGVGTLTLVERDGRTTLTSTIRYKSREVRDTVLKTPMEKGVSHSYDNLAAVLASMA